MCAHAFPDIWISIRRLTRLTLLRLLHFALFLRSASPPRSPEKVRRIALLRFSAVGDFVLAIPSIAATKKAFPEAQIMLITAASGLRTIRESTVRYNHNATAAPWLEFVHPSIVDKVVWIGSFGPTDIISQCRPEVRSFDPDLCLILPQQDGGSLKSLAKKMLLLRILGVTSPVHGWKSGWGPAMTKWLHRHDRLEHAAMAPLNALREVLPGAPRIPVEFKLNIPDRDLCWSRDLRTSLGWQDERIIAVSPSAVQPHKKWPVEKFAELCRRLQLKTGARLAIVGTRDLWDHAEKMAGTLEGRVLNLCGKTSITQLAAWLKECDLLVGNDGGTMHIAAAVGCRCVAIMPGIEYPGAIEPWGNREWSVRHPVSCAPCYSFTHCPLGHNRCVVEISTDTVLERCLAAFAAP